MPSKHVDDETWRLVEKETFKAITETQTVFKQTEVLKILIKIGLQNAKTEDYKEYIKRYKM